MAYTGSFDRVRHTLSDILDRPGAVLFSGVDTLVPGAFYVVGFNPGGSPDWTEGDPGQVSGDGSNDVPTIRASLERDKRNYNDWTDARYGPGGTLSARAPKGQWTSCLLKR